MNLSRRLPVAIAALSMFIAGCLYLLFRTESLILFEWFRWLHLMPVIAEIRMVTLPLAQRFPEWFIFSLPDGLWLLSFLLFVRAVWADASKRSMWVWAGAGLVCSFGHELFQAFGLASGTFDWSDVLAYLIAACTALGPRWVPHNN